MDLENNEKLSHQSPIMITPCRTIFDKTLKERPLVMDFPPSVFNYVNNGHTIQWNYLNSPKSDHKPQVSKGPILENQFYQLEQFHMHWGQNNEHGSEHFVNDESYAGEIHLVHYNSSLYSSFDDAKDKENGLLVVAIFMRATKFDNVSIDPLVKHQSDLLDIKEMLPQKTCKYYTYFGSLTTPPFTENVRWVVIKDPIPASFEFLKALRKLKSDDKNDHHELHENHRKIMPLNERNVYRNFCDGDCN